MYLKYPFHDFNLNYSISGTDFSAFTSIDDGVHKTNIASFVL